MRELTDDRLLPDCKMRSHSRYASDEDCTACGLGEGSACATYERLSAARLAKLRAKVPTKPEPSVKAIAWEIASFLGVTPWAVDDGGVEVWERYKPLAEAVTSIARRAAASTSTEGAGVKFEGIAKRKLDDLMARGWAIDGYAITKDGKHGFVTTGAFVGWWLPDQGMPSGLTPPASKVTTDEAEERG